MAEPDDQLSVLNALLKAEWFRLAWRVAILLGGFVVTAIGGFIYASTAAVRTDVDALQRQVEKLMKISDTVDNLHKDVGALSDDIAAVKLDTATVKGILQEMRRQNLAENDRFPWPEQR